MRKRVLVFGTFDGVHSGHEFFLRSAKGRGTELVVGVARDAHVATFKGRKPLHSEQKRLEQVQKLSMVDSALLCDPEISTFNIIEEVVPDLLVLGHDQQALEQALITWMENSGHYVPMIRVKKV
ncbi:FAD synthase [Patescibacteria group bacterium]|nr:MAG: FAD synthase [Patescibacteria group bacterium]